MMQAKMEWSQGMRFVCENHGHKISIDASSEHGGEGQGASPKELLLDAMMGCTAMDVLVILKKMRQDVSAFKMDIEAETTQEHPVHFKSALLSFHLEGTIAPDKALKAVSSSLSKYCGVNYMASKTCRISYRVLINGELCGEGQAQFI